MEDLVDSPLPIPKHNCERCHNIVGQWWMISASQRPSRAMTCFYLCNGCMEALMFYLTRPTKSLEEFVSDLYKVKEEDNNVR